MNTIVNNRGFGILEVIIASLLMTIALVGIAELYVANLRMLEVDRSQYVLNYAATSQLERLVCLVKIPDEDPADGIIDVDAGGSAPYLPNNCPGCKVNWQATKTGEKWLLEVLAKNAQFSAYSSVEIVNGL